jgi:DNA-binding MarR family transcriptional regulator
MPHCPSPADRLPRVLLDMFVGLVRRDGRDLTARQFAIFLVCYLDKGPHTVRGLASQLHLSSPAISRSLERLGTLGLTLRARDQRDRRSVLVRRTRAGLELLADLRDLLTAAACARDAAASMAVRTDPGCPGGSDEFV